LGPYLESWEPYLEARQPKGPEGKLATFYARHRFAYNFESIQVSGMNGKTLAVYSLITKIAFAYSSLEHLESSIGVQGKPGIHATDLARKIRVLMPKGVARVKERMPLASGLEARLNNFFNDPSNSDVRPVIEQFRHSLFHGKFTPTGWGLKGADKNLALFESLAQVTLRQADQTFTKWVKSQHF
jgi:hypothetical protein